MKTADLFPVEERKKIKAQPKPDLIRPWMKRNGITVHFAAHMKPWCWSAWVGTMEDVGGGVEIYEGRTRNEALKELAEGESIPTWDEKEMRKP